MLKDAQAQRMNGIPDARGAEWVHHMLRDSNVNLNTATAPDAAAIQAYVNNGRWIAECPDCQNAQLACRTDKRFLCNECGNVVVGGLWRPVVWPLDLQGIESVLEKRPLENQNWVPGETVADLAADNKNHGVK